MVSTIFFAWLGVRVSKTKIIIRKLFYFGGKVMEVRNKGKEIPGMKNTNIC